jgi:hypothetical protein
MGVAMANIIINLQDFRTPASKVFTGRDRGEKVRKESKIDNLVGQSDPITIVIPEDIRSINPSFLEEFLVNVVTKLGKAGFYKKFQLDNKGRYKVEDDLNEAIDRILREENALA